MARYLVVCACTVHDSSTMATLTRFWIEFVDETEPHASKTVRLDHAREAYLRGGCGVTAWDLDDALDLIAAASVDRSDEPQPPARTVTVSHSRRHVRYRPGSIGMGEWR